METQIKTKEYDIFSRENKQEKICRLSFSFKEYTENNSYEGGKIEVFLTNKKGWKNKPFSQFWSPSNKHNYEIDRISDFLIPSDVSSYGIGKFIWQKIYENLPNIVRDNIEISGTLSQIDNRKDERWNPITNTTEEISNLIRRNQFWKNLITDFSEDNKAVFYSNKEGDGEFSGKLNGDYLQKATQEKIVATLVSPQ